MDQIKRIFLVGFYLTTVILVWPYTSAENIALGKPATQLGTYRVPDTGPSYGPELAVDGITTQTLEDGSCAHPDSLASDVNPSDYDKPAWWSLDLLDTYIITNITIYFRTCCLYLIDGNTILVGTDKDQLIECAYLSIRESIQSFQCREAKPVRFVKIQQQSYRTLGICEVIIDGYLYNGSSSSLPLTTTTTTTTTQSSTSTTTTTPTTSKSISTTPTPTRAPPNTPRPTTTTTSTPPPTPIPTSTSTPTTTTTTRPTAARSVAPTITPKSPANDIPPSSTFKQTDPTSTTPQTTNGDTNELPVTGSTSSDGVIAGIIVAVILLLIILAVIIFCLVRRSRAGKPMPGASNLKGFILPWGKKKPAPPASAPPDDEAHIIPEEEESPPPSPPGALPPVTPPRPPAEEDLSHLPPPPAVKVADLGAYIATRKEEEHPFRNDFRRLPNGKQADMTVGEKEVNKNKNRFLNIKAYEHSRVVLDKVDGDPSSDYINANYMSGYGGVEKVYVAAQGPMNTTVNDTWRLIWQTNSNRIIMVTNCVEGGRTKCEQYWPDKNTATYGNIKVTFISIDNYAAYVIRVFSVEYEGEFRTVHQFHFTSWPDHGVPVVATELLEFRRRIKSFDRDATGPIIIHCSAGVGRTGTYIAVDILLQQGQAENEVDVWGVTKQMRSERVNMIQTLDQYIFVHDALHEALLSGETVIPAVVFREKYTKLCEEDPESQQSLLAKQFEILDVLKTSQQGEENLVALEPGNISKNRDEDIVPSNRYRPFLSMPVSGTTSYVNAVYADSFRTKLAYLITQMPLPHTVVDFWRLIYDHHCNIIVMLNPDVEKTDDIGIYWPEDKEQSLKFGPIEVFLTSVNTEHPHIIIRDFKLTNSIAKRQPTVRQFQLTSWVEEDAYRDARGALLEIIDMVEQWQDEAETEDGTLTIQCMDGVSRSGLFVPSLYAVEQLKVDQEVDVFRAVKQVRIPRPQFIQDLDQYKFVHEMVLAHLDDPEGQ